MPYIKQADREYIEKGGIPSSAGELNYVITKTINDILRAVGVNYDHINEMIGVLECAKLELYRRVAAEYEDRKITENGDVYKILEDKK